MTTFWIVPGNVGIDNEVRRSGSGSGIVVGVVAVAFVVTPRLEDPFCGIGRPMLLGLCTELLHSGIHL